MSRSIRSKAVEKYLVSHEGRTVTVYQMPIPQFHGRVDERVVQLAAAKAVRRGWRKIVLRHCETPFSIFEGGYCLLLAMNLAMAQNRDSLNRYDQLLCKMDEGGEVFATA